MGKDNRPQNPTPVLLLVKLKLMPFPGVRALLLEALVGIDASGEEVESETDGPAVLDVEDTPTDRDGPDVLGGWPLPPIFSMSQSVTRGMSHLYLSRKSAVTLS